MSESHFSYIIMIVPTVSDNFMIHIFPIAWYYGSISILLSKYLNGRYRMIGNLRPALLASYTAKS